MHTSSSPTILLLLAGSLRLAVAIPPPISIDPIPSDVVTINVIPPAAVGSTGAYVPPPLTIVPQEDNLPVTMAVGLLPPVSTVIDDVEDSTMSVLEEDTSTTSVPGVIQTPPLQTISTTTIPPNPVTSTTMILKTIPDNVVPSPTATGTGKGPVGNGSVETSTAERRSEGREVLRVMLLTLAGVMGVFWLA